MIELHKPSLSLTEPYLEFIEEMKKHGEKIWDGMVPKLVPETTYWATIGNQVVGRIALRHELNASLSEFGGHIGYEVRPSFRRKGVATDMLKKLLLTPKAKEIGRLLLTCAPDNVGSNKTIQANGGVLTKTAFVEKWQRNTNYYWIDLASH